MSVDASDDARPSAESEFGGGPPDTRVPLASVVVQYDGTPDRRTLYPDEATDDERLTHWISADADAFVRLDTVR